MRLLIGIVTRGNDLYHELVKFLFMCSQKHKATVLLQSSPYSASYGQELVFKKAVVDNFDYLLMIDSDVCPPGDCIERLLQHDKDVVIAPVWFYDMVNHDVHYNISRTGGLKMQDRVYNSGVGLERVKTAGFGVMLVKVSALKKFVDAGESFTEWSPMIPEDFKVAFSDNIFFKKAEKLGIESYVDWDVKGSIHYRVVSLCDKMVDNLLNKRGVNDKVVEGSDLEVKN